MGNIGLGEIAIVMLVALLVFGPNKLPEIMRNLGKAVRTFQDESQRAARVLRDGLEERPSTGVVDRPDEPAGARASVPPPILPPDPEPAVDRTYEDT